jgi:tellurite resistance-related uncharacterized protein
MVELDKGIPQVGLRFQNPGEAWEFWVAYGIVQALMASQRKISDVQAFQIEIADDSRIKPKAAHEMSRCQVDGTFNLSFTCAYRKNYLQKRGRGS